MRQVIRNGAIVIRDGRLLLLRTDPAGAWTLPGGVVDADQPDVDEAMDQMLQDLGIHAPAIEEDFVETIYLAQDGSQEVYNLYAPTEWKGEAEVNPGTGSGWFALEELESIEMNTTVRDTLLDLFGVRTRPDDAAAIVEALNSQIESSTDAPGAATTIAFDGDRRAAGLDVLRTLRGDDDPVPAFIAMQKRQPGLTEDIVDFALGDVWSHPAIDRKTRSLQVVAMLAALGRSAPLRAHIDGALNHGATPEQVVQTLRMVAVYAGFPAALEAWRVMEKVFAGRGIKLEAKQ